MFQKTICTLFYNYIMPIVLAQRHYFIYSTVSFSPEPKSQASNEFGAQRRTVMYPASPHALEELMCTTPPAPEQSPRSFTLSTSSDEEKQMEKLNDVVRGSPEGSS